MPAGINKPLVTIVCANADAAGTPIHVAWLVRSLGTWVDFDVVLGEHGPLENEIKRSGCRVTVIPQIRSAINPLRDLRAYFNLRAHLIKTRPDLIHAHGSKPGLLCRLLGRTLNIPCVHTVHGWGFGRGRPIIQSAFVILSELLTSKLLGPSLYVFVSHADAAQGRKVGIRSEKSVVIWNSVEDHLKRASPASSEVIFMAARVAYQKDHRTLLTAFNEIDFGELRMAGGGTDSPEFIEITKRCAGRRMACVLNLGSRNDIDELLASTGVFALTSRYEGLPLSIIEAMCAGLPIVATDVGGNRELVEHGINGFLVPVGNAQAVREALILLRDPGMRERMGRASRLRYEQFFAPHVAATKLLQAYQKVGMPCH